MIMLKFCSLYSGSSGNSLFVSSNNTNILIDAGVSAKKIDEALTSINFDASKLDAILVTHEHSDHIQGLGVLSKKYDIPVYANKETWGAMSKQKEKIKEENQNFFQNSKEFTIGDLRIKPFDIPHDAANPCGFNIFNDDTKISIATDIGHVTENIMNHLRNSKFILLESNYEPEVLKYCSYPYSLKQRIDGPNGHLSNISAGKTIANLMHYGINHVTLGHLSKESNFPELAYKTVIDELMKASYKEKDINIDVASRNEPGKLINC
jgi:phosphoribosyl 1,2-cyclic phosphodiesterase